MFFSIVLTRNCGGNMAVKNAETLVKIRALNREKPRAGKLKSKPPTPYVTGSP